MPDGVSFVDEDYPARYDFESSLLSSYKELLLKRQVKQDQGKCCFKACSFIPQLIVFSFQFSYSSSQWNWFNCQVIQVALNDQRHSRRRWRWRLKRRQCALVCYESLTPTDLWISKKWRRGIISKLLPTVMRPAIKSAFTFLVPLLSILYEGEFWTLLGKSFCCLNLMEEMHHNSIPVKCSALHISRSECCYAMRLNIVPSSSSIWSPYETNGTLTSSYFSGTWSALNYVKGGWANKLENHFI